MAGSLSIWGLGGGSINTQNLIDLEISALGMKKLPYTTRKTELTTLQTSYNNFKKALQSFTDMLSSNSLDTGGDKTTTYSVADYFNVKANSLAISGSYTMKIESLAKHHQLKSDALFNDEEIKAGKNIDTTKLGISGKLVINNKNIDITEGMTGTQILQTINNAGAGVKAYAINNKLFLTSDKAGEAGKIEFGDDAGTQSILQSLGFKKDEGGKFIGETTPEDAVFYVNGEKVTSSSNTVSGILPGVTFELSKATEGKTIDFTVGNSSADDLFDKIKKFVDSYNGARSTLNSYTGEGGALTGKSATRALQSVLTSMFGYNQNGNYSFTMGIAVDKNGVLSLNEEKLKEAISGNQESVQAFFFGSKGLTGMMNKEMENLFGTSGIVTKELSNISKQLTDINRRVEDIDSRNAILEEAILDKYAKYETNIGTLNAQLTMMQALIKSLNPSKD